MPFCGTLSADPRLSMVAKEAMDHAAGEGKPIHVPTICIVEATYLAEKKRIPAEALPRLERALRDPDASFRPVSLTFEIAFTLSEIARSSVPESPGSHHRRHGFSDGAAARNAGWQDPHIGSRNDLVGSPLRVVRRFWRLAQIATMPMSWARGGRDALAGCFELPIAEDQSADRPAAEPDLPLQPISLLPSDGGNR